MKTKIKMLRVKVTEKDNDNETNEEWKELHEKNLLVSDEELQGFIFKLQCDQIEKIEILGQEEVELFDYSEMEVLEVENQELKDKLDNVYNIFDNIYSCADSIKNAMEEIEDDIDTIQSETIDGQDECEHE